MGNTNNIIDDFINSLQEDHMKETYGKHYHPDQTEWEVFQLNDSMLSQEYNDKRI